LDPGWTFFDTSSEEAKAYVNREVACLRRMLNKAVDWGLLEENHIRRIKLFDEREFVRKRYLRPEEMVRLVSACSERLRPIVFFALYTGRRLGEIVGMRWQEVDLQNGYVYFPRTKKMEPDQVALAPRVIRMLEEMESRRTGEHVFSRRDGSPIKRFSLQSRFKTALKRAGIEDFRFHDLRHTAISYMVMNGIDLKTIGELVGHTTAEMVDKRYGHLSPDHKRAATGRYGRAMDKLCGPQSGSVVADARPCAHGEFGRGNLWFFSEDFWGPARC